MRQASRAAGVAVALLLAARLPAATRVSIPGQSVAPGGSAVIPVTYSSDDGRVSAIQFDLTYESAAIGMGATIGEAARGSGKSFQLADLGPGRKRFLLAGLNRTSIAPGVLVNLFLDVSFGAPPGQYILKLSNLVGADADAHPVSVAGVDGELSLQGAAGSGPRLLPAGVLNGASLLPSPVAPGEILTLGGAGVGPATPELPADSASAPVLGGTSVLFDGVRSPILYAAPGQVNLVVPYEVHGKQETRLQVMRADEIVADLALSVADSAPALFTLDSSGSGAGAILNQDTSVNTSLNPAEKNSVVSLFATGAGQTDPPGVDGEISGGILPKPLLPVFVRIGGLNADVRYAGAAPGLVAGVLQVNCVVPSDAPSGYTIPILLIVGNAASQAGVTLAIR